MRGSIRFALAGRPTIRVEKGADAVLLHSILERLGKLIGDLQAWEYRSRAETVRCAPCLWCISLKIRQVSEATSWSGAHRSTRPRRDCVASRDASYECVGIPKRLEPGVLLNRYRRFLPQTCSEAHIRCPGPKLITWH